MKTIRLVAWNTLHGFAAKKVFYLFLFLIVIIAALQWQKVYNIFYAYANLQLFIEQVWLLSGTLGWWYFLTAITAIIFASGVLPKEQQDKSIAGVLAKPISRWTFVLGKWSGVLLFFCTIFVIGAGFILTAMIYWQFPILGFFYIGLLHYLLLLVTFTTLSYMLSIVLPRILAGGLAFSLFYFHTYFLRFADGEGALRQLIVSALYYVTPVHLNIYPLWEGSLQDSLHLSVPFLWATIGINGCYGALLLLFAVILYQKKDIAVGQP
ncbi:ABC transporter permease subunit [Fodinibius salsisoli]|uniref:ABC transporter permease subunit n=1 Tax=Fodinibius salsisoli TaxID=2820877 RepID=A0ABT3PSZ5_9BACT|nr:ABC transporter permease subunit [Fodinibius salsisoli]MCW9708991.1 ABC transporter permease subunit [Fodinibius salsisoli]